MKVSELIARLQELHGEYGDMTVFLDVCSDGLLEIDQVDVDTEDTGIMIWAEAKE